MIRGRGTPSGSGFGVDADRSCLTFGVTAVNHLFVVDCHELRDTPGAVGPAWSAGMVAAATEQQPTTSAFMSNHMSICI